MLWAVFTACLGTIVSPAVYKGGGKVEQGKCVAYLVSAVSIAWGLCHEVGLWVLEASSENHKAVRLSESCQVIPTSIPQTQAKLSVAEQMRKHW